LWLIYINTIYALKIVVALLERVTMKNSVTTNKISTYDPARTPEGRD
jgi:hypothetical protein